MSPHAAVQPVNTLVPLRPKKCCVYLVFASFAGLYALLFSFPLDRKIPFWPHFTIVEIFFLWLPFITPITTVIAPAER
jgi:hypothetical protein